jgi:hypothetical protein
MEYETSNMSFQYEEKNINIKSRNKKYEKNMEH